MCTPRLPGFQNWARQCLQEINFSAVLKEADGTCGQLGLQGCWPWGFTSAAFGSTGRNQNGFAMFRIFPSTHPRRLHVGSWEQQSSSLVLMGVRSLGILGKERLLQWRRSCMRPCSEGVLRWEQQWLFWGIVLKKFKRPTQSASAWRGVKVKWYWKICLCKNMITGLYAQWILASGTQRSHLEAHCRHEERKHCSSSFSSTFTALSESGSS